MSGEMDAGEPVAFPPEMPPWLDDAPPLNATTNSASTARHLDVEATPPKKNALLLETFTGAELFAKHPTDRPYLVEGMFRVGEVANLVAPPKAGKTMLVMGLARAVTEGGEWLGRKCAQGNVLHIDNELHPETLAGRSNRLGTGAVHYVSLRGRLEPLSLLAERIIATAKRINAKLIILDALYRFLEPDASENDNAAMAKMFNMLDKIAKDADASIANVHHDSKGQQIDKKATDRGAGAGAFARAADTLIVINEPKNGACLVTVVVRSSKPVEPFAIRKAADGITWELDTDTPAASLAPESARRKRSPATEAEVLAQVTKTPQTIEQIRATLNSNTAIKAPSKEDTTGMLLNLVAKGRIFRNEAPGVATTYSTEAVAAEDQTRGGKVKKYLREGGQIGGHEVDMTDAQIGHLFGCTAKTVQRARREMFTEKISFISPVST